MCCLDCLWYKAGECEAGKSISFGFPNKCRLYEKRETNPVFDVSGIDSIASASFCKGNQRKWLIGDVYVKEQFFYQGVLWKDYLVEVIASRIGEYFSEYAPVLKQEVCTIEDNGRVTKGCFSTNFCKTVERFLSFNRLCSLTGESFDYEDGYEYNFEKCIDVLNKATSLDFTGYLIGMVLIDYLVGNEDRHLNNFGVIVSTSGFRIPPLFDFGIGLFEHDEKYKHLSFRECLARMRSLPFSADNQLITDYVLQKGVSLPKMIDLSGYEIPSLKAGSYLRNRCSRLGIELKGVQ